MAQWFSSESAVQDSNRKHVNLTYGVDAFVATRYHMLRGERNIVRKHLWKSDNTQHSDTLLYKPNLQALMATQIQSP